MIQMTTFLSVNFYSVTVQRSQPRPDQCLHQFHRDLFDVS